MKKNITFLTGTRADFGKLKPLIELSVQLGHQVHVFITGMHLENRFGLTSLEVKRLKCVKFHEFKNFTRGYEHERIFEQTYNGFESFVSNNDIDLVVLHGDRVEVLAVASLCFMKSIRIAHIEGGEVSGTIDETFRHAVSKMATTHFVSSDDAKLRLRRMGEENYRIYNIGSPEFDVHRKLQNIPLAHALSHYNIGFKEYAIFCMHPVFNENEELQENINIISQGLAKIQKNFIIIRPNNEPGSELINEALDKVLCKNIVAFPSMRFDFFSILLRHAKLFVGNSSAGVREAPFFGVQSINIGTRQRNRSKALSICNLPSVIEGDLEDLVTRLWGKKWMPDYRFGDGDTGKKFRDILMDKEFWKIPLQKMYQYSEDTDD